MECNNKIILRIVKVLRKGLGSVASRAFLGNYDSQRTDDQPIDGWGLWEVTLPIIVNISWP